MYKVDGSSSNYTRLYVRLGSSGQQASQKLLTEGNWRSFTVDKAMHILEQQSDFFVMGHDPSLDSRISDFFNAH